MDTNVERPRDRLVKSIIVVVATISLIYADNVHAFSVTGEMIMHGAPLGDPVGEVGGESYSQFMKSYQTSRRYYLTKASLARGAEYIIQSASTGGFAVTSLGNPAVTSIGRKVFGDAVAGVGNHLRQGIYNDMEELLKTGMKRVVLAESIESLTNLTGTSAQRAKKLITRYPDIFSFQRLTNETQGERDIRQEVAIEVLSNKLAEESYINGLQNLSLENSAEQIALIESDLRKLKERLSQQIKVYTDFSRSMTHNMQALANSSQIILTHVKDNYRSIQTNKEQIGKLQSTLFGKMTGAEKLEAIESGWFADLTDSERSTEVSLAKAQADAEEAMRNIQTTISNLPSAARLFTNDPNTLQAVDTVCTVADGAIKIAAAAAATGPFAAVMVFAGVAGSLVSSRDNSSARHHAEIMNRFRTVIDNQIRISEQINDVYRSLAEGQRNIYALLVGTAEELVRMGKLIEGKHREVLEELDLVARYSLANTRLVRDLADRDPGLCHKFLNTRRGDVNQVKRIDLFASYEELKQHFVANRDLFGPCSLGLLDVVTKHSDGSGIHSLLLAESYGTVADAPDMVLTTRDLYEPAYRFFIKSPNGARTQPYNSLVHVPSVSNYTGLVLELYPYTIILKDTVTLDLMDRLNDSDGRPYAYDRARLLLSSLLTLINEAIFQQEVIAGHGYIDTVREMLFRERTTDEEIELRQLLESNPFLQANLALFLVQEQIRQQNTTAHYYGNLLLSQQSYPFLDRFFTGKGKPVFIDSKWYLDLGVSTEHGSIRLPLPNWEQVNRGTWVYSNDLVTLHKLRAYVADHLSLVNNMRIFAQKIKK